MLFHTGKAIKDSTFSNIGISDYVYKSCSMLFIFTHRFCIYCWFQIYKKSCKDCFKAVIMKMEVMDMKLKKENLKRNHQKHTKKQ